MERFKPVILTGGLFALAVANISLAGGWNRLGELVNGWSGFWGVLLLILIIVIIPAGLWSLGKARFGPNDNNVLAGFVAFGTLAILGLAVFGLSRFVGPLSSVDPVILWMILLNTAVAMAIYFGRLSRTKRVAAPPTT